MGYWKVDAVYRSKSDCSVPSTNLELRFASRPTITFAANAGCGTKTYNFSVPSTNWGVISNSDAWYHALGSPVYVATEDDRYDCINGACRPATIFATPGIYESLSVCEQNCGPGCGGVCISNSDWGKISSLAAMVKNKDCS